jgi:glutamate dehydrogenase (NAD(P)+)
MGTNEQVMAWMMDTYSIQVGNSVPAVVTGKPISVGGSEGRREATGRGVAHLVRRQLEAMGIDPRESTVVIQGFGNVGAEAALAFSEHGLRIVAISDVSGGFYNPRGIDLNSACSHVAAHRGLAGWNGGEAVSNEELLELPCTVLVPAAMERVITPANAGKLRCRVLAEAANGPTTNEADLILEARGDVEIIPDILCNIGGVVVSYFEWVQDLQSLFWTRDEVLAKLAVILDRTRESVEKQRRRLGCTRRLAALTLGIGRVAEAKAARGLFP